jgi:hypothetical protein
MAAWLTPVRPALPALLCLPLTPPPAALCFLALCCLPLCLQVVAATKEGQYVLTRPAAAYKKVFTPLAEKAAICFEASTAGKAAVQHGSTGAVQHVHKRVLAGPAPATSPCALHS